MGGFGHYLSSNSSDLLQQVTGQVEIVALSVFIAAVIGVVVGALTSRSRMISGLAISTSAVLFTIPSFALLGLLIAPLGLGFLPVLVALVVYALLPIVRNTVVGLNGVDPALVEAGWGMGMGRIRLLLTVEFPMAWPVILAGIRVSVQLTMGIAAIGAYVNGPGLGKAIFDGLNNFGAVNSLNSALAGTIGILILALLFDLGLQIVGRFTTTRGIRV
ncbi:MAG TPA: ABC transporter permease [Acidimicrobiales bacterium]|nr:ABC transporter permease [Acidimicrobiales bacterium]